MAGMANLGVIRKFRIPIVATFVCFGVAVVLLKWSKDKAKIHQSVGVQIEPEQEEMKFNTHTPPVRILVAMDGTGNKPFDEDGKSPTSNVVHITRGVVPQGTDNVPQVVYYNWGIGTEESNAFDKLKARATGANIRQHIMNCYRFLVLNYVQGAEIFFVGFSRGSFAVLSLAGMIEQVGLLPKRGLKGNMIGEAYYHYKTRKQDPDGLKEFKSRTGSFDIKIKFLGVFDIVKALGGRWFGDEDASHHVDYGPNCVENALHAVSIDENRKDFAPTLLENERNRIANLTEIWFPGVHSDVGGGYIENKLSNHAVRVMAKRMAELGVEFYPEYIMKPWDEDNAELKLHHVVWLLEKGPRNIPKEAKFDDVVLKLLKSQKSDAQNYMSYCNPNLATVNDGEIKQYAEQIKAARP